MVVRKPHDATRPSELRLRRRRRFAGGCDDLLRLHSREEVIAPEDGGGAVVQHCDGASAGHGRGGAGQRVGWCTGYRPVVLRQLGAGGQQLRSSAAGRPPVLLHAIDDDSVEIRDQHWDLKKLGR